MAGQDHDPFDSARSAFVKLDDLIDRLLLIAPRETLELPSTLPGSTGTYEKVVADVLVLDGVPTEVIEAIPCELESIHFSGKVTVGQLKPKVKVNAAGVSAKGLVLGRLGKQKATTSKAFNDAWVLKEPTDADKALARPHAVAYLEQFASDPFTTG